jgi:hypothetical protein
LLYGRKGTATSLTEPSLMISMQVKPWASPMKVKEHDGALLYFERLLDNRHTRAAELQRKVVSSKLKLSRIQQPPTRLMQS